ncbi:hypothetical protein [Pseudomonas lini]|uniref:Alpha/beta hydrolase n=1 Tax=Pseudomonas lini TaxID=163011 RepID=A0A0J6K679_9PSED|nr:hypothetical protein [Pseudomonas lini]KAB0505328.1 hypothetical protein F7R14_12625 [Pseudomonas lini]KMM91452.1 hypothetical protein TU81_16045 [Pseudomonas lini]SDS12292.1 hypothetical protein SAMN04490191_0743 [Pseudomonas lini]
MTALTIFFCGTGSTKFDDINANYWDGELVSTLASHHLGREFAEWIVVDGPGSGNLQADDLFTKSEEYGLSGTLFGKGWEQNVQHAINIIKGQCDWQREQLTEEEYNRLKAAGIPIEDVKVEGSWFWRKYNYGDRSVTQQALQEQIIKTFRKDGVIPTQVNLVGWSRGGISCHMLANAMFKDSELKNIPVNIFAIDPVPGIGNFQDDKVKLGPNVKEYVGFYARDERSKGFSCVIPQTATGTKTHIYPIPGRHATMAGNATSTGGVPNGAGDLKILVEPGRIVRHFAEVCLKRWGVQLDKSLNLTHADLENLGKAMVDNEAKYRLMHKYSYTYFSELDQGERYVSLGSQGVNFSAVKGAIYAPATGLTTSVLDVDSYQHIR